MPEHFPECQLADVQPTQGGSEMHQQFAHHARFRSGSLLVVLSAAMAALATFAAAAPAQPVVINGGARQWLAFDPGGRSIGQVQFLQKIVVAVNTSNAPNPFKIFYEPQHITFCAGTLAPGGTTLCGMQPSQRLSGGYFQMIAAQPVLMGGYSDVPVMRYVQGAQGVFGADPSTGMIQNVPFVWQQGCPPRQGSECPNGVVGPVVGPVVGGTVR
jgi:hypothetical protein